MKIPNGFFSFDIKDTMRLVVWIAIAAFTLGGVYAQRQADLARLTMQDEGIRTRVDRLERAIEQSQVGQGDVVKALNGVQVELRYVNEKIDVMRTDFRSMTGRP